MAKFFTELSSAHHKFIAAQKMFFVATAPNSGRINLSPKGLDSLRILNPMRVGYLDITGSGNETAAHLRENGRVTFMFCAFAGDPLILRLYGRGRFVRPHHDDWKQLRPLFGATIPGERQLILLDIESVQTSCGFGVPLYEFQAHRPTLIDYSAKLGPEGTREYQAKKNTCSIDGLPTGIFEGTKD